MAEDKGAQVLVGQIGAPHGVRGAVRLRPFTEDAQSLVDYGPLRTEQGDAVTVHSMTPAKNIFIATLVGVDSREAAEKLRNARLYVPRERLPEPEDEEWYHVDLIGLAVQNTQGGEIGTVAAVHDHGAGDLLEIRLAGGSRTALVPFTREVVPIVEIAVGRLVIDPPEGLLD